MKKQDIAIVGYGSQGSAWAECLRDSGWEVSVFLSREGGSFQKALKDGFNPRLLNDFTAPESSLVAMLCPDQMIGAVYGEVLSGIKKPLTLVLAHGYAVYADDLSPAELSPDHSVALLAPKSIGPKLRAAFQKGHAENLPHTLLAGFYAPGEREEDLIRLGRAIGFAEESLIATTFQEEAIGDLISEQGLICGAVFNYLDWTIEAMQKAGIPPRLIKEECVTELELIASLIQERGPAATFQKISQAAQCGTLLFRERLESSGVKREFSAQMEEILSGEFVKNFKSGKWKPKAQELVQRFDQWERSFE